MDLATDILNKLFLRWALPSFKEKECPQPS